MTRSPSPLFDSNQVMTQEKTFDSELTHDSTLSHNHVCPLLSAKLAKLALLVFLMVFSNVCIKGEISLYHQESVQCHVIMFLAAF